MLVGKVVRKKLEMSLKFISFSAWYPLLCRHPLSRWEDGSAAWRNFTAWPRRSSFASPTGGSPADLRGSGSKRPVRVCLNASMWAKSRAARRWQTELPPRMRPQGRFRSGDIHASELACGQKWRASPPDVRCTAAEALWRPEHRLQKPPMFSC